MKNLSKPIATILILLIVVASNALYVISEVERGVALRFGEMIQADC